VCYLMLSFGFLCRGLSVISVVFHIQTHRCRTGPSRGEYEGVCCSISWLYSLPSARNSALPLIPCHIIAFAHQRHIHWMYLYSGICPASCRCVCRAEKTFSRINFRIFRLACAWRFVYTALRGKPGVRSKHLSFIYLVQSAMRYRKSAHRCQN